MAPEALTLFEVRGRFHAIFDIYRRRELENFCLPGTSYFLTDEDMMEFTDMLQRISDKLYY